MKSFLNAVGDNIFPIIILAVILGTAVPYCVGVAASQRSALCRERQIESCQARHDTSSLCTPESIRKVCE